VSDATVGHLTGAKRIGGADAAATSLAAASEAVTRGVPGNILFLADPARPTDAALAGAAAARAGGLLVLTKHADVSQVQGKLDQLHLATPVDQFVVVHSKSSSSANTVIIVISIVLGGLGLLLLLAALAMRSRSRSAAGPRAAA
jgi:hypothetical protein